METRTSTALIAPLPVDFSPLDKSDVTVAALTAGTEKEVIQFLSQRPLHTVAMLSLIRDNGLVSPLNRGTFYGCRDANGYLEGVALIGHATLLETVSSRALRALAEVARDCPNTHMIMGEQDRINELWSYCANAGQQMRLACTESLLEFSYPIEVHAEAPELRLATKDELDSVLPIQAEMAFEESGVDPREVDPEGFRRRCLRRIEQGRTWVVIEDGKLMFKADIISETSDVVYLEGVWVNEEKRLNGYGASCMSQLSRSLLERAKSVCLLVNYKNTNAQAFYRRCGYQFRATYLTIFLPKKEPIADSH
jgi:predicted GNAT family acetyltransferase